MRPVSSRQLSETTVARAAAIRLAPTQLRSGLAGVALVAALAIALVPGAPAALVVSLGAIGAAIAAIEVVPAAVRLIWGRRGLLLVAVIAIAAVLWMVAGLMSVRGVWEPPRLLHVADGTPLPAWFANWERYGYTSISWPWRVGAGGVPLPLVAIAILSAAGSVVLVADAVRVQIGLAGPPNSLWRSITQRPAHGGRVLARAIPGLILIVVAVFLGMSLTSRYIGDRANDPMLATICMLGIGCLALLIIASPVAIGLAIRIDLDKAVSAREAERRRFAAHLHDSVLQTLALIQRKAHDPAAVAKLARRQEHALRAWMAGEADLTSATLASAVRDVIAEVEDEHGITIELAAIGDATLDSRGEELVAAAREALRNAARHAPGAPVYVFLDVGSVGAELFIRDDGPGFDFDAVPAERRGLRDAVIGRMAFTGGSATVESSPGEGTEIALRLPLNGGPR